MNFFGHAFNVAHNDVIIKILIKTHNEHKLSRNIPKV